MNGLARIASAVCIMAAYREIRHLWSGMWHRYQACEFVVELPASSPRRFQDIRLTAQQRHAVDRTIDRGTR